MLQRDDRFNVVHVSIPRRQQTGAFEQNGIRNNLSNERLTRFFAEKKECRAQFKETHCALLKVHPFLMADHFNRFTCFNAQKTHQFSPAV